MARLRPGHEQQALDQALAWLSHLLALAQAGLSTWSTLSPSQTLTEPSKHNSGDVSSRKPSLTGPKLAQVPSRIPAEAPTQSSKALGSCGLTLQRAFPKAVPVPVSPLRPQMAFCPLPQQARGPGKIYQLCPERSLSDWEFHKVHLDQQIFPSPKTANR